MSNRFYTVEHHCDNCGEITEHNTIKYSEEDKNRLKEELRGLTDYDLWRECTKCKWSYHNYTKKYEQPVEWPF